MTTPARHYRWEPFQPGHTLSLRHGAFSERAVSPLAARIVDQLFTDSPWLATPAFRLTVLALARAEAQAELLHRWLDEHGPLDDEGRPRPAMAALDSTERRADRLRQGLGLTPSAWAALHRAVSAGQDDEHGGVAAIKAVGAQIIANAAQGGQGGADQ